MLFFKKKDVGEEEEQRYFPLRLAYFKDLPFDYILAGHFHTNFEVRRLAKAGYFVYPGSPVSIARKETGSRQVALFEIGKPIQPHTIATHYFEEVVIKFTPFQKEHPLQIIEERLNCLPSLAKPILVLKGFVDTSSFQTTEEKLIKAIKQLSQEKKIDLPEPEIKEVKEILKDKLFKRFLEKLSQRGEKNEEEIKELAIRAIVGG
jgi:DNA repair exonuclease SbcCD nuclease subunit